MEGATASCRQRGVIRITGKLIRSTFRSFSIGMSHVPSSIQASLSFGSFANCLHRPDSL